MYLLSVLEAISLVSNFLYRHLYRCKNFEFWHKFILADGIIDSLFFIDANERAAMVGGGFPQTIGKFVCLQVEKIHTAEYYIQPYVQAFSG